MTRRDILQAAALLAGAPAFAAAHRFENLMPNANTSKFSMHFAPHFGMFQNSAGPDLVDQLKFAADQGFTAWEDNGMKHRSVQDQERIAKTMAERNMRMGVFVASDVDWNTPNLTTGSPPARDKFLKDVRDSIDVAKRVNATWMTVVPGVCDPRLHRGYQTAHVIDTLRKACDILEPHGLIMVIENLNFRDHPNLFLTDVPQAFEICRAVNSASCKILNDMYHAQIQEGNIIPNIDLAWSETAYFQIGDNPGRCEPTSGEMNYKNIFSHIQRKGFKGVLGMEHGNAKAGKDGELALIAAYRACDPGLDG